MACPFGVPKKVEEYDLMMKCTMCYDRTSVGKKPMCATVCPSGALFYGTREQIEEMRPNSTPVNNFIFGQEKVKTKVNIMMPKGSNELRIY
ncbi:Formate dehydrogenase, nitrate-inducible, iron-sulfur subunit [compost metagenome]